MNRTQLCTSEEAADVRPQPPNTCPMIDEVLSTVRRIYEEARGYQHMEDAGDLKSVINSMEWFLRDIPGLMEDIRANAEKIRQWGEDWKTFAIDNMNEEAQNSFYEAKYGPDWDKPRQT